MELEILVLVDKGIRLGMRVIIFNIVIIFIFIKIVILLK